MTTTIKVTSHNYPARVQIFDDGRFCESQMLKPENGEVVFHCTTSRELRIVDVEDEANHVLNGTAGEKAVRLAFNPSGDPLVAQIKRKAAELIDLVDMHMKEKEPRLAALAKTAFEEGAMWAVKAAT